MSTVVNGLLILGAVLLAAWAIESLWGKRG